MGDLDISCRWGCLHSPWSDLLICFSGNCVPASSRNNMVAYIQGEGDKICNRTITVTKPMKHPVYVYYQLENFYQNHRRYVKSRNDAQLRSPREEHDVKTCAPEDSVGGEPIVPCGLVAWSLFNDTYSFSRNSQQLPVNKKGISWKSDRENKFGKNVYPKNFQTGAPIGGGTLDPNKSRESAEGKLNAISLHMIHKRDNRSKDEIIESMKGLVERKREELHKLVLEEKGSVVPRECKEAFLKMSKVLNLFYRKDDGFTSQDLMNVVKSVIYEPVSLQEESLT